MRPSSHFTTLSTMAAEENTATRFDPIEESRRQWLAHGWDEAADGMTTVISVMRIHQLFLARVDAALKPFALTFSRYEVLTLLSFTRSGTLPMSKISARLQVHATSTTNSVDRLEKAGLVARRSHPDDRRPTLVDLTEAGLHLTRLIRNRSRLPPAPPRKPALRTRRPELKRQRPPSDPPRACTAEISWTSKYSGRIVESVTLFTSDHWRNHVPQHSSCPAL